MAGRTAVRGQALAEFAIVFPLLMLVIGGIIQGGIYFWGINTLNQVVRDTGRWAATQTNCADAPAVIATANAIAAQSSLVGYASGSWTATDVTVAWPPTDGPDPDVLPDPCPPTSNQEEGWVEVTIVHTIPVFFPLFPSGISSSTLIRMEPAP